MKVSEPIDMEDDTVIVTGGARGIGKAISKSLANYGANTAVFDIEKPVETKEEIEKVGRRSLALEGDVRSQEDVNSAVNKTLEEFGQIDVLVNNAGISTWSSFEETSREEWNRVMDINLWGSFLFTQKVFKHVKENGGGKIVFMGSMAAEMGSMVASPAYTISKGGIHALVKNVAKAGAPYEIYSNGLAPSPVNTEMTKDQNIPDDISLLNRKAEPEDIAETVSFLASNASNYITGEIISVNGGYTLE